MPKSIIDLISYALIFAATVKIMFIAFLTPVMGYANNTDFLRQSSCTGIWQVYEDKPKGSRNPTEFVNSLQYDGEVRKELCMKSSDNIFPYIVTKLNVIGSEIDFREISLWKLFLTISGMLFLVLYFSAPGIRLLLAIAFFLVFGDICNILYMNTLYLEFSVICSGFFVLVSLMIYSSVRSKPNSYFLTFTVVYLLWFGFSKQQYMPLASAIGIVLSVVSGLRWKDYKLLSLFLIISVSIPVLYASMNREKTVLLRTVHMANMTDTFLGAVLPEAMDKEAALSILNLPASCMPAIGKTWYSSEVRIKHPCPDLMHTSRFRLLKLFLVEPATFIEPIRKAVFRMPPFYPSNLAVSRSKDELTARKYIWTRNTSLSRMLNLLPQRILTYLNFVFVLIGPVLLFPLIKKKDEMSRVISAMIGYGSMASFYAIVSSVFGDGYIEIQKHAVLFLVGVAFQITGFVALLPYCSLRLRGLT